MSLASKRKIQEATESVKYKPGSAEIVAMERSTEKMWWPSWRKREAPENQASWRKPVKVTVGGQTNSDRCHQRAILTNLILQKIMNSQIS